VSPRRFIVRSMALCALAALPAPGSRADVPAPADAQAAQILGRWLPNPPDGLIEISRAADGHYRGQIIGGDTPYRTDDKNPDPAKRTAQLIGRIILQDLTYEGHGRWSGGTIYDPDTGHTYSCNVDLLDANRLKLHGYVLGMSFLGRSQMWTRYSGTDLLLPKVKKP
jgi:uncharacterized protein (DUF2147 family)